ncbi:MAG: hypothetical protein IPL05_04600 [Betaproteobacteria bacterium]|nr:hypothetical protein [Betaproteobacteria bacterium]
MKTLGLGSLLGGALLLYFLINKKRFFVALYLVVVITSYLNSISRTLLLAALITPLITYLVFRVREKAVSWGRFWLVLGCTGACWYCCCSVWKIFGHFLTSVFDPASNAYDLIAEGETSNVFNYFLSNYTFMWSSVDSGIDSFFKEGPFFTVEPIYALFFGGYPLVF